MRVNQNHNQTGILNMITQEQAEILHNSSLEVLERTGVKIFDKKALELLADAGAFVDMDKMIACIPSHLVKWAVQSAPSRFTLANPQGKRVLFVERNQVYYGSGTDLPDFRDPYTGEIRPTLLSDVENVAKVIDKMENYSFVTNMGIGTDCNQRLWDMYSLKAQRMYCNKPNMQTATDKGNLMAMIDMAAEMAGGYEELRRSPSFFMYNEPVSPLMNGMEAIQKLMLCAEYGIPTTYCSGGVSGGTSPVTLSGSIVVSNAECLAGLVIHQLTRKGAPFIYGYVYGAMDMQSTVNIYGGPELGMIHAVMSDMARYYDLPVFSTGGCTDAMTVDAQAGTEGMYSILTAALSGGNLVHDTGYTGIGSTGNLSNILLSNEQIGFAKRFIEGIKFDETSLAIDLIAKVGHGGDYVSQKHTAKHFREEVYYPKYFNRKMYNAWSDADRMPLSEKLDKAVIEMIEGDNVCYVDDRTLKVFDEIITRREAEIEEEEK